MANVAKLKKKAAEFELKRQFDKALAVYIEILDDFDQNPEEVDVALFNRVGDMLLRQGNVADAVDYYERAVDRYAEGGFFNNAIALCNKILRQSPGRSTIYYKLGKISAQKGFKNDAKQNFLEYADRMQKSGRMDEAFRALKEFADLCPDQDDIRLMLAEQLSRQERGGEAIEQLQTLVERYSAEGRDVEARATMDRIKAIDPDYKPRATGPQKAQKSSDLVFLDVYAAADVPAKQQPPKVEPPRRAPEPPPAPPEPMAASTEPEFLDVGQPDSGPFGDLQSMSLEPSDVPGAGADMLDIEPTSFHSGSADAIPPAGGSLLEGLETTTFGPPDAAPARDDEVVGIDGLDFLVPPDAGAAADPRASTPDLEFFLPESSEDAGPQAANTSADSSSTGDFGLLDISVDGAASVQPGTQASVPEVGIDDALQGLPMMELEVPTSAMFDDAPMFADSAPITRPGDVLDMGRDLIEDPIPEPAAAAPAEDRTRRSTIAAEQSVELLVVLAGEAPGDFGLRRRLAETRLDSGDREGGLADLEAAMVGYERDEDLGAAASVADEIARITPESVRIHQKRVEYAFRTNERVRLVGAYLDLAAALLGDGQTDKARTVYKRVLDLAPDDIAAQAGLAALSPDEPMPTPEAIAEPEPELEPELEPEPELDPAVALDPESGPEPDPVKAAPPRTVLRRPTMPAADKTKPADKGSPAAPAKSAPAKSAPAKSAPPPPRAQPAADSSSDDSFINLGDWLRDDAGPRNTRMVVEEKEPSGDEEADFADMLRRFKQGVADNVDAEDHQSHYDLGVAFKEMGLIDEAISEFQRALRAPSNRLPTYEALGQCFVEKGQQQVAKAILTRALAEPHASDEQLVGVLYLLGHASEELGHHEEALAFYQRVFVVDIQFRDVADRLTAVERAAR